MRKKIYFNQLVIVLGMLGVLGWQCSTSTTPTSSKDPEIINLVVAGANPYQLPPNQEVFIVVASANIPTDGSQLSYEWRVEAGQIIIDGENRILYKTPNQPGQYEIEVLLRMNETISGKTLTITVVEPSAPTPVPRILKYHPVTLIAPEDNIKVVGTDVQITLTWTSTITLEPDEYFFVEVKFVPDGYCSLSHVKLTYYQWVKETTITIDSWVYGSMCSTIREVTWTVYIKRPANPEDNWQASEAGAQLSPVSKARTFIWEFEESNETP